MNRETFSPVSRSAGQEKDEIIRYSRHLLLPQIGIQGQEKLGKARVLIVGAGGLGSPVALYLAAAGVGTIGLLDFDEVELSNLQRQVIHSTRDIGRPKVASAKDRIRALNPAVNVEVFNTKLTSENALEIMAGYDIIVDGTDNFQSRYLINDACVLLRKPDVYGSIYRFDGLASVFDARKGPCYRCLYPDPPAPGTVPSCGEAGVVGVISGMIGTIQANEVVKLIVGGGEPLIGRLLSLDAWQMQFREYAIQKDPACPVCGEHPTVTGLIDYEEFCGIGKRDRSYIVEEITPVTLKERLEKHENIQLIDIREPHEKAIAWIEGARHIPFGQVQRHMDELDREAETVFICKSGQKSVYLIEELMKAGYGGKLLSLKDGIIGWAKEVDSSMPVY
ncbi:molybdopterin-synthase adenylyltransferase MoeB [Oxalobacter aliiformigenes]|uniref:molybdopterin-synthase adenylyltransferase MoeB n=1 Tax=Oxalobacter aliiformigenes TaxID=2946593 RepID=UPI0022AE60EB|nr:molybdopterin-synthase adenylyltransferase MoeB [Oxalobacter aliiformigenes]WAV88762.1 molybdopterin-synthase adenylyltransferase MoeB [Oxalobacter aliiformigenes]